MKGAALTIIAALAAAPIMAQTAPPITTQTPPPTAATATGGGFNSKMINNPIAPWSVYGASQTNTVLDNDGPKGYPATRVTVSVKGANPWDAGAGMAIPKAIAAGDIIYIALYLRAPNAKDGEKAPMSFVGVIGPAPAYTGIVNDHVAITNQWAQYYAVGTATQAYAAGAAQVALHLADNKQVIDIGPVRVFDLGPGYDTSRLPKNQ